MCYSYFNASSDKDYDFTAITGFIYRKITGTMAFEDKADLVQSTTPWGYWYQTMEDVTAVLEVPLSTKGKNVNIKILPNKLTCFVNETSIFSSKLFASIICDESTWTIEDEDGLKIVRIFLVKSNKTAKDCWSSLFIDDCKADFVTLDTMKKRMLQERYHTENPGFDFSQAEVTGNYQDGGPDLG